MTLYSYRTTTIIYDIKIYVCMYVCMCIGIYVCMSWGIRSSSGGESSVTWRVWLCMYVGESSVTWLRPELFFFSSNPDPEGQPTLLYLLDGDGHDAVRYAYTPPTYIHTAHLPVIHTLSPLLNPPPPSLPPSLPAAAAAIVVAKARALL